MNKFKKILLTVFSLVLVLGASLGLASCDKNKKRQFVRDGKFKAFKLNEEKSELTFAEVTIKDDKIAAVNLDVIQSQLVVEKDEKTHEEKSVFQWKKSKKELGNAYGMKDNSSSYELKDGEWKENKDVKCKLEWFEQAELIEDAFVKSEKPTEIKSIKGRGVSQDGTKLIESAAGVTIKSDLYINVINAAILNAKEGKTVAFELNLHNSSPQLTFVSVKVDKDGKLTEVLINTKQSTFTAEAVEGGKAKGNVKWNKTKKELKDEYKMKNVGPKFELKDGKWTEVKDKKCELEWFEQAELIEKALLASQKPVEVKSIDGRGVSQDGTKLIESAAGVTIKTDGYLKLFGEAFNALTK